MHDAVCCICHDPPVYIRVLLRVDVCLPGAHTHGTIVVRRRSLNQAGKAVIDHIAGVLFSEDVTFGV